MLLLELLIVSLVSMKYLFSVTIILCTLIGAGFVHAQTDSVTVSCSPITQDNQYQCCGYDNGGYNTNETSQEQSDCAAFRAAQSAVANQVNGGGGSQSTAPVNTNTVSTPAVPSADLQAAASCNAIQFTSIINIAVWIKCLIGAVVIPGIFMLAFVVFLWGVLKFMRSSSQTDKQDAKQYIIGGLIGLFIMVSVWGIIRIINTTFGISSEVPTLQTDYLTTQNAPSTSTTTSPPAATTPTPASPTSNSSLITH
jgi:hypothetical protein